MTSSNTAAAEERLADALRRQPGGLTSGEAIRRDRESARRALARCVLAEDEWLADWAAPLVHDREGYGPSVRPTDWADGLDSATEMRDAVRELAVVSARDRAWRRAGLAIERGRDPWQGIDLDGWPNQDIADAYAQAIRDRIAERQRYTAAVAAQEATVRARVRAAGGPAGDISDRALAIAEHIAADVEASEPSTSAAARRYAADGLMKYAADREAAAILAAVVALAPETGPVSGLTDEVIARL